VTRFHPVSRVTKKTNYTNNRLQGYEKNELHE